ncbi:MAG: RimK family alpha-L-glutamate ligase [Deltaproteobacteria bacterium]|nr:MAG: RimK family alpha-L-glutamate ligase [Deltaproteobacteria bacterium]
MSFGTTEETPGKHFHLEIRANYLVTSVDKDQRSIFGETPEISTSLTPWHGYAIVRPSISLRPGRHFRPDRVPAHEGLVNCAAMKNRRIALGRRLRHSPLVQTLGVRPNIDDYSDDELNLLRSVDTIYYPSHLYEDVFLALGKRVFPANYYRYMGDKIKQTELFILLDIPHPRTRFYYGGDKERRILEDFSFPVIAKIPRGSSRGRGIFLIRTGDDLQRYLKRYSPAYIQEALPIDRDLRVVLVGGKVVHAYWRIARRGEFRSNVSQGARICLQSIPASGLRFAERVARLCHFGEVGLDICYCSDKYLVLEANMVYGLEGFRTAGLDIYQLLTQRVSEGEI